jgi:hypothetical protein
MSNDDDVVGDFDPDAFILAAWALLSILVERETERDPNFGQKANALFDGWLGTTIPIAGEDDDYENMKREARKIFRHIVRRDAEATKAHGGLEQGVLQRLMSRLERDRGWPRTG